MRTEEREVTTKIDGTTYKRKYQAVFPDTTEGIYELFSKDDALDIINTRLEVVQDNRARSELIKEHTPDKPKKSVKKIDYNRLYSSKPKEIPVDNEHLKKILKKNQK